MKNVISKRYYPYYHGKMNTQYSYRSYYVGGNIRPGSSDYIVGQCPDSTPDGWALGKNNNPLRPGNNLNILGFIKKISRVARIHPG